MSSKIQRFSCSEPSGEFRIFMMSHLLLDEVTHRAAMWSFTHCSALVILFDWLSRPLAILSRASESLDILSFLISPTSLLKTRTNSWPLAIVGSILLADLQATGEDATESGDWSVIFWFILQTWHTNLLWQCYLHYWTQSALHCLLLAVDYVGHLP